MPSPLAEFVIDTSVVVKWYVEREEPDLGRARFLLDSFGDGRCILRAPQLLTIELANVLTASRRLPESMIHEALDHLAGLKIDWKPFSWDTLARAVEIARACNATVYDAYFLAVAHDAGGTLVTADEGFLEKARGYPRITSLSQLKLPV